LVLNFHLSWPSIIPIKLGIRTYWIAGGLGAADATSELELNKLIANVSSAPTVRIFFISMALS
jgi:hypothetical protein